MSGASRSSAPLGPRTSWLWPDMNSTGVNPGMRG
jgi:hypothetical protein